MAFKQKNCRTADVQTSDWCQQITLMPHIHSVQLQREEYVLNYLCPKQRQFQFHSLIWECVNGASQQQLFCHTIFGSAGKPKHAWRLEFLCKPGMKNLHRSWSEFLQMSFSDINLFKFDLSSVAVDGYWAHFARAGCFYCLLFEFICRSAENKNVFCLDCLIIMFLKEKSRIWFLFRGL